MSKQFVQNKYKVGEVVFEKVNPERGFIIDTYLDEIYYCIAQDDPKARQRVFFERELEAHKKPYAKTTHIK